MGRPYGIKANVKYQINFILTQPKCLITALLVAGLFILPALGDDTPPPQTQPTILAPGAAPRAPFYPPDPHIPNGFGVQLKTSDPAVLDQVQSLGLKWVRRGFYWEGIEKRRGVYDFSETDSFMDAARKRGLSVIGDIVFSNKIYGVHAKDEPGRAAYAKYAAALAAHYKDYDIVWEIWNEPNTLNFWRVKPKNLQTYAKDYTGLVAATAPAMHAANPNAIVLAGSVSCLWSDSYQWMAYCFKDGMLKTGIDVWSIHPYNPNTPEEYPAAYEKMRDQMVAAGGSRDFPIINSERGFPIGKAQVNAGGQPNLPAEYQAWFLVRQYLIDMSLGVKVTSWYEWSGKEGFGLYQPGRPTPAFNACKVLIDQLRGYRFDQQVDIGAPRDYVLRFTNDKGGVKLVAWTAAPLVPSLKPGGAPHVGSPDQTIPHAAKIPVEATGALATVQLHGDPGTVRVSGASIELNLTGAPQYVTVSQ
jgi:hypothetical protein